LNFFCLESHILSFPKVSQIPPESPCITASGTWKPVRCETGFSLVVFLAACTYGLGSFMRWRQIPFCVLSRRNDPPIAGLVALTSSARSLFAGFSLRMLSFSLDSPDGICDKQIAQRQVSFRRAAAFPCQISFHQCSKLIRRQAPTQQTY